MRTIISTALIVLMLFSFSACTPPIEASLLDETLPVGMVASEKDDDITLSGEYTSNDDAIYAKADKPLTPEVIESIPIATDSMTSDELRQICVDYLKLSVSCQWVSDGNYYLVQKENVERNFTEGKLYGGIPYVNIASGNLYRFMEYYDSKTGIFDSTGIRANPSLFATACSGTAGWAWSRVINSAEISWTHSINKKHGFVPVGPYVYDFDMDRIWDYDENGEKIYYYDTKKICKNNASQVMYESYALTHIADCYSRTGHVAMAVSEPVVVRNEDGTINGKESYIMIAEQGQYTKAKHHIRTTSDGTEYRIRGNDGRPFTFLDLYKAGYLVHTFEEFLGSDPVEDGEAKIAHKKSTATIEDLTTGNLVANYPISDIFTTVRDSEGKIVFEHVERTIDHCTRALKAADCIPASKLEQYSNGDYTIEITSQLSTGALVPVYEGAIIN